MKTRILSLIMAVCMVAALIPAVLLSVTAAETTGFETTFELGGENWPTPAAGNKAEIVYHNNWSAGRFVAGVYEQFNYYSPTNYVISNNDNMWDSAAGTGLYQNNGRFIFTGANNAYYVEGKDGTTAQKAAFSFTYTAPYEGTIDIGFKDLLPSVHSDQKVPAVEHPQGDEVPGMYVAIVINDTMIWPTANGSITDPASFALIRSMDDFKARTDLDMLKNVNVNIGDKVHFVFAKYNLWFANATPTLSYHDGYEVVPSRMNQTYSPSDAGWPVLRGINGIGDLLQTSKWQLGAFNESTKAFTSYGAQRRASTDIWTGIDRESVDYDKNSGILLKSSETLTGAYFFGTADAAAGVHPAYRGVAVATGTGDISLNVGSLFIADENQNAAKNATAYVDVYQNDKLIGTITVKTDAKGVATADKSLTGLTIAKGDVFTFVGMGGAKVKTLTAFPVITFNSITSFMTTPATEKYALALEDAAVVVGDSVGIQFTAYATIDTYKDATSADLYVWDASISDKTLENATKIPLTITTDFSYQAIYTGFAPKEMVDEITTQVVVLKDGVALASSEKTTFTVAETAQAQFDASYDEDERELMAAVLNYGTYAQKYFNYKTDNLANKNLDGSYATINANDYLYYAKFNGTKVGSMISASEIDSFSLYLDNSISIRLNINLDDYEKENCKIYVRHGMSEEEFLDDKVGLTTDLNKGAALIENISLKELSAVHYFGLAVQEGRYRYYGYSFTYSVESFAARMMDSTEANLPELLCAMMELGKLAAAN